MDFQEILSKSFYFWGTLIAFPLWLLIYIKRPKSRREMKLAGIPLGIGAVVVDYFYAASDYWQPTYIFGKWFPIEDFLYGFIFGGIVVELYEFAFRIEEKPERLDKRVNLITIFFAITIVAYFILISILEINSVTATVIIAVGVGIYTLIVRKDLFVPAMLSAVVVTVFQLIWYKIIMLISPNIFADYWTMENLSGILIWGIPLEELTYAFGIGFGVAHFYEMLTGRQLNWR